MGRIAAEGIDEVRDRADLLEVVGGHVKLKRTGREWVGLCPFHDERTPSFSVNPDKGVYLCRGCGASGNVFTFVQQIEGLSFAEAVQLLADRYNIMLQRTSVDSKKQTRRSRLLDAHAAAVEIYERLLAHGEGQSIRNYCESRNITPELIARHRVGFGGWTPNGLTSALTRSGFTVEEIVEAGLARKDGRSTRDVFWGRLVFPIFDASDRCIGFGGRLIPDEFKTRSAPDRPKYLNTSSTPLYDKSSVLYGINWARPHAMRTKRLILVEGYTDVIAMHAAGVPEAVATCGTALTTQHVAEISRRFGDIRVILCLDGDDAGQSAAQKAGDEISRDSLNASRVFLPQVFVALMPAGADPADLVAKVGVEPIEAAISTAVPIVEFLLRRAVAPHNINDPLGRTAAVKAATQILANVSDDLLRHEYVVWVSDRTQTDVRAITAELETVGRPKASRPGPAPAPAAADPATRLERSVLAALAESPHLFDDENSPKESSFTVAAHSTLFRMIHADYQTHSRVNLGRILGELPEGELRHTAASLSSLPPADDSTAKELFARLKAASIDREIAELKRRLREMDPRANAGAYDALFEDLLSLEHTKRAMTGKN